MTVNPYEVLGVSPGADEKTIKSAFKKLAKKFHPDVNGGDKASEQKFKEINEAYSILTNKSQPGNPGHPNVHDMFADAQTIFDAIFRGGSNVVNRVQVDPELLIKGGVFDYTITTIVRVNGRMQPGAKTHKVVVEPDTPALVQIALPGADRFNFIQLIPGDTERYRVSDFIHLTETKKIAVTLAMTGGEVPVVTPSGREIKIKIPAGLQPGSIHRVRGMGLRAPNELRGDYNVQFAIQIPAVTGETDEELAASILELIKKERSS